MIEILIRAYLLGGMVAHKLLWETLKRRQAHSGPAQPTVVSPSVRIVKLGKLAFLAALLLLTAYPYAVIPISSAPAALRWIGLAIYTLGLLTAMSARIALGANWSDIEQAGVLREQGVSRNGVYGYIRHPIYVGDLLLLAGLFLALNTWFVLLLAPLTPYVLWKAMREERMLVEQLPGYADYCRQTRRFIPFVV
ncbi:MAG: isoprenylcysteine carboxylmethyltransferase family protein [Phycisphaerae bacterium]